MLINYHMPPLPINQLIIKLVTVEAANMPKQPLKHRTPSSCSTRSLCLLRMVMDTVMRVCL